jgi:hypothetical protein
MLYPLIFSIAFTIVATVVCIVYTGYIDQQSNRRWCNAVVAIDDAFRESQTQSAAGRRIAEEYRQLRVEFEC